MLPLPTPLNPLEDELAHLNDELFHAELESIRTLHPSNDQFSIDTIQEHWNATAYREDFQNAILYLLEHGIQLITPWQIEEMSKTFADLQKISEKTTDGALLNENHTTMQEVFSIQDSQINECYLLALQDFQKERYQEAIRVLRFLLNLNPGYSNVWSLLGSCQQAVSQFQAALWSYNMSLIANPDAIENHIESAACYIQLNDRDNARDALGRAHDYLKHLHGQYERYTRLLERLTYIEHKL